MHEKADAWWGPNQPSPQRTRCYAGALTAIPRCPWPPSDRFIVCLERTCSVFTTALGAELEWRHVTPATCVALVNLSASTLVSTNPCALTRVGAGARPAGRSADQPGRPSPNDHDTRHGPLPQRCFSPPSTTLLPENWGELREPSLDVLPTEAWIYRLPRRAVMSFAAKNCAYSLQSAS